MSSLLPKYPTKPHHFLLFELPHGCSIHRTVHAVLSTRLILNIRRVAATNLQRARFTDRTLTEIEYAEPTELQTYDGSRTLRSRRGVDVGGEIAPDSDFSAISSRREGTSETATETETETQTGTSMGMTI